jgi:hypothetical protein
LRRRKRFLETANPERVGKRLVAAFGQEIELVPQVFQVVVHRRRGEEQHFRADAGLDNFVHQLLIAAFSDEIAGFVALARSVIAEVVRLVDDDEVVVASIERFKVDITGIATFPTEVGVGKHVVAEAVDKERVEAAVGLVYGPVFPELIGAKHKDALVL